MDQHDTKSRKGGPGLPRASSLTPPVLPVAPVTTTVVADPTVRSAKLSAASIAESVFEQLNDSTCEHVAHVLVRFRPPTLLHLSRQSNEKQADVEIKLLAKGKGKMQPVVPRCLCRTTPSCLGVPKSLLWLGGGLTPQNKCQEVALLRACAFASEFGCLRWWQGGRWKASQGLPMKHNFGGSSTLGMSAPGNALDTRNTKLHRERCPETKKRHVSGGRSCQWQINSDVCHGRVA